MTGELDLDEGRLHICADHSGGGYTACGMSAGDIVERLSAFLHERAGAVSAYVFGSQAEGRPHRESDIDVAVLLSWEAFPTAALRFEERIRLIAGLAHSVGRNDVDVVILNDAPPQFARYIVATGNRVLMRDAECDQAFTRATLSRAADLEPFLQRTRRTKLAAIGR